jgi:hypothetical protein
MSRTKKLSKKNFCKFAKKRSLRRKMFLQNVKRLSTKNHKARSQHLKRLCKNAKDTKTKKFCKLANKFSKRRINNDLGFVKKSLKYRNLRHRDLKKFCK